MHSNRSRKEKDSPAFTLVELLVVIAIIAVLAGLIFAASGKIRAMGDRTKCVSNLRQVGMAIGSYMGDHDASLPGPLWTWQSCWNRSDDFGSLGTVLAPYVGVSPDGDTQKVPILVCPAWQRDAPYPEDEQYIMNSEVKIDDAKINPWGDADIVEQNGEPGLDPEGRDTPRKLAGLTGVSLAQTWALQEWDQRSDGPRGPTWAGIAKKPVHGDSRNMLFFDLHVESVPVPTKP